MSAGDSAMQIDIHPQPSEEEASVILAALALLSVDKQASAPEIPSKKPGTKWTLIGRRSAHHSSPHARKHWSRDLAWLERAER